MGRTCNQYSFEQLNRFADNEMPQDRHDAVAEHCRQCPDCRRTIVQLDTISNTFKSHVEQQADAMDRSAAERHLRDLQNRNRKTEFPHIFGLLGQHLYLKLGLITTLLVVGVFMSNLRPVQPSGPSAIVKYVDTEMPSVMIIETEKHKHTIIWFSET